MKLDNIFIRCFLCPGLCISYCPVYSVSRDRATAPNIIARSGYYMVEKGDREIGLNLLECTGCGNCGSHCPIDNPLPKAIRIARRYLYMENPRSLNDKEDMLNKDTDLYIYKPDPPSENILKYFSERGFRVKWIDTSEIYIQYSKGLVERIKVMKPFVTDEIEILDNYLEYINGLEIFEEGIMKKFENNFVYHIPCRLEKYEDKIISILRRLVGDEISVISGCVGGGLLFPLSDRENSKLILRHTLNDVHGKVITLCVRARDHMRNNGIDAYTILDVIGGEENV